MTLLIQDQTETWAVWAETWDSHLCWHYEMTWQNFPHQTFPENTFANLFKVGNSPWSWTTLGGTELCLPAECCLHKQLSPAGSPAFWFPFALPSPILRPRSKQCQAPLTLCPCHSSGSPLLLTQPRSVQACRSQPNRSTSSGSVHSQKPPPAWCRAAPPPGTSRWKPPGRRSAGGQQRQHRQSADEFKRAREGVCAMLT